MTPYLGALGLILAGALLYHGLFGRGRRFSTTDYEFTIICCTAAIHAFYTTNNRLPGNAHELQHALEDYYLHCVHHKMRPKFPF